MVKINSLESPPYFETYSSELKELIIKYMGQLDTIEQKAYVIAMDHLGTSFNIVKSNGFNDWIKKNEIKI
jgi:hypothetical protein